MILFPINNLARIGNIEQFQTHFGLMLSKQEKEV